MLVTHSETPIYLCHVKACLYSSLLTDFIMLLTYMQVISLSLPKKTIAALDSERGLVSRSAYANKILSAALKGTE